MPSNFENYSFLQKNSPDGGFLQSEEWRKFQETFGRKTFHIEKGDFWANIIEHELPVVGKYFYIPRGPIINTHNPQPTTHNPSSEVIKLAKENDIGWIRFDANKSQILDLIRMNSRVAKAPHDMQPKEIFLMDITKSEEQLLSEMKSKTRYNIKLAQKYDIKTVKCEKNDAVCDRAIDEFVRLIKITAKRDRITPHPDGYYRKMFDTIPEENLKLYLAEYEGKIIAANIVVFFGKVATYLHGASDNAYRNVMAPYLLQWQAMLDAKEEGCNFYDLGGVKILQPGAQNLEPNGWLGITRFKTGFSTITEPTKFPGSYDIVINPFKYNLYKILQQIKALF